MGRLAVVAIGGNSLIKDSAHQSVPDQYLAICETAVHITTMIESGWDVIITHGNGPQVGFILLRSELSREVLHTVPLDVCGADTQGAIGYLLQQALHNEFLRRGIRRRAVTVVTQVRVAQDDPAFSRPSKPIGPFYSAEQAQEHARSSSWAVAEDSGRGWRRLVPSPMPLEIIEADAIVGMVRAGYVVVAGGGGGIPVTASATGALRGVEAVIDKDLASGLLARTVGAELFLVSTAVTRVSLNFNSPDQRDLDRMSVSQAQRYLAEGHFAAGSMAPKVRAVIDFVSGSGGSACITSPEAIEEALQGKNGTWVTSDGRLPHFAAGATVGPAGVKTT